MINSNNGIFVDLRLRFDENILGFLNDDILLNELQMRFIPEVQFVATRFELLGEKMAPVRQFESSEELQEFQDTINEVYKKDGKEIDFDIMNELET